MTTYVVCYDLHKEGQNYECVIKKLKAYGTYCRIQRSVWIVCTSQSAKQVRDDIGACLDDNDKLFVGALSGEGAWKGYPQTTTDWLQKNL